MASIINAFALVGGLLAPSLSIETLILTLLGVQFILQAGHFFDEIRGRPWSTEISTGALYSTGTLFLLAGVFIGIYLALKINPWILIPFLVGGVFSPAYSLEVSGGIFHSHTLLGIVGGSLVFLTSYYIQALGVSLLPVLGSVVVGANLIAISVLYQRTKSSGPRKTAWRNLKIMILFWNLLSVGLVLLELLR